MVQMISIGIKEKGGGGVENSFIKRMESLKLKASVKNYKRYSYGPKKSTIELHDTLPIIVQYSKKN